MKILLYEHSSLSNWDEPNCIIFVLYFNFRGMQISFNSKVTGVQKAVTAVNVTSLCSTNLVLFLGTFPYQQTTKFVLVTEPAWLPGSYEEPFLIQSTHKVDCQISPVIIFWLNTLQG